MRRTLVVVGILLGVAALGGLAFYLGWLPGFPFGRNKERQYAAIRETARTTLRGLWDGGDAVPVALALSPDGRFAFSAGADGTVKKWEVETGTVLQQFPGQAAVTALAVAPGGGRLAAACADGPIRLWDLESGKDMPSLAGHSGAVGGVAFARDGVLVSGGTDRTVRVWGRDAKGPQTLGTHSQDVTAVAVSADGRRALTGSADGTLSLWDVAPGKEGAEPATLTGHTRDVTAVALAADGRHALSASRDRTLILWDLTAGKAVRTFRGHANWVTCVAFSPDGRLALSAGDDLTVRLWQVGDGEEIDRLDLGQCSDCACSLGFAPDGRSFLVGTLGAVILRCDLVER